MDDQAQEYADTFQSLLHDRGNSKRFDEMAEIVGKAGGLEPAQWPGLAIILRNVAKDEREACARIADEYGAMFWRGHREEVCKVAEAIAQLIRERVEK